MTASLDAPHRSTAHALRRLARLATNDGSTYAIEALHYALTLLTQNQLTHNIVLSLIEDIKQPPVYNLVYQVRHPGQGHLTWMHAAHCPTQHINDMFHCAEQHLSGFGEDCEKADENYYHPRPIDGATGTYRIHATYADGTRTAAHRPFQPFSMSVLTMEQQLDIVPPHYTHLTWDEGAA